MGRRVPHVHEVMLRLMEQAHRCRSGPLRDSWTWWTHRRSRIVGGTGSQRDDASVTACIRLQNKIRAATRAQSTWRIHAPPLVHRRYFLVAPLRGTKRAAPTGSVD